VDERPTDNVLPVEIAAVLRADPRIAAAVEMRSGSADGLRIATLDPSAYHTVYKPELSAGSLNGLPDGSIALYKPTARSLDTRVGSSVTLRLPRGSQSFRVAAIFSGNELNGEEAVLSWADYLRGFGAGPDHAVLVVARPGVSTAQSRAAVDTAVADQPLAKVDSIAGYKAQLNSAINTMTALLGALLATAVIIALFGIANTLSLSVLERTRESALLRALGLTRPQLRRTLTIEAFLIGLMGGVVGVAVGGGFGWAISEAFLHDSGGGPVDFPWLRIAAYLLAAGLAGVLAALVPAHRAARTGIITGLADT
jgi:putative ABC transport system permease protein